MTNNNNLDALRASMYRDFFGDVVDPQGSGKEVIDILFARPGLRRVAQESTDQQGLEQFVGKVSAASNPITRLPYAHLRYKGGDEVVGGKSKFLSGPTAEYLLSGDNPLAKTFTFDTDVRQNVMFTWDAFVPKQISSRNLAAGGERSGFVSVSKIARAMFGEETAAWGAKLGNFDKVKEGISNRLAQGNIEPGSGMSYLQESYAAFGKPAQDMTDPEHLQAILHASYAKAKSSNRVHEIRQLMYLGGVKNLGGVSQTITSVDDPYGLGNVYKRIASRNARGKPQASAFYSGGNPSGIAKFIGKVEHFSGAEYAQDILKPVMERLEAAGAGSNLSYMLAETGHLYAGQGQLWDTYRPVPLEVLGVDVSEGGIGRGKMLFGPGVRSAKKGIKDGEIVSASKAMLDVFEHRLTSYGAGIQSGTTGIAVHNAFRAMRVEGKRYLGATVSRGIPNTTAAFSTSFSAYDENESISQTINRMSGKIGSKDPLKGDAPTIFGPLEEQYNKRHPLEGSGVSPHYYALKSKESSVPLEGIEAMFHEGFVGEKDAIKGIHHRLRPQEITDTSRIRSITSAMRSYLGGGQDVEVQAQSVGMTSGEYRALLSSRKEMQGAIGRITGRQGKDVVTSYSMPVGFLAHDPNDPVQFALNQNRFGDPGFETTSLGRQYFQGMGKSGRTKGLLRPIKSLDIKGASLQNFEEILNLIAKDGDFRSEKGLTNLYNAVTGTGVQRRRFFNLADNNHRIRLTHDTRVNLREAGYKIPKNAGYLIGANFQDFDNGLSLSFGAKGIPGTEAALVTGLRSTILNPTKSRFESYGGVAAMVSSMENFEKLNTPLARWEHLTNLVATQKGGAQKFVTVYNTISEARGFDHRLQYAAADSGQPGHIVGNIAEKDVAVWGTVGEEAAKYMGYTKGAIEGEAKDVAKALGKPESSVSGLAKLMLLRVNDRPGATEDIMNQAKALRPRLEMIRRWGQGIKAYSGAAPSENPFFMKVLRHWERTTGLSVDPDFIKTGMAPSSGFIGLKSIHRNGALELTPQSRHLGAISSLIESDSAVKTFAQQHNLAILGEKEALELFGRGPNAITFNEISGAGVSYDRVAESGLFSEKGRAAVAARYQAASKTSKDLGKGFFIELTDSVRAGLQAGSKKGMEEFFNAKYVWVPEVNKALREVFGIQAGHDKALPVKIRSDSMEHSLLGLISSFENQPGKEGVSYGNQTIWGARYYKSIANYTSKQGALRQSLLYGRKMKDALTARLLPRADVAARDLKDILAKSAEQLTESDIEELFTVKVGKNELNTALKEGKGKRLRMDKALKALEKDGVWGGAFPNPLHSAAHPSIVKFKLAETLAEAGKFNEPKAQMSAFLAWKMNRDHDKDTVQVLLDMDANYPAYRKAFQQQVEAIRMEYRTFQGEVKEAMAKTGQKAFTWEGFIDETKKKGITERYLGKKLNFLQYGKTPPLSFAAGWSKFAIANELAGTATDQAVATRLNLAVKSAKYFKNQSGFQAESIAKYRAALGAVGNAQDIVSASSLFEAAPLQSFISKAGQYSEATASFLDIGADVAKNVDSGGSLEESIRISVDKTKKFFYEYGGYKDGVFTESKLRLQGLISGQIYQRNQARLQATGLSGEELAKQTLLATMDEAATIHGTVTGVAEHALAENIVKKGRRSGFADALRKSTRAVTKEPGNGLYGDSSTIPTLLGAEFNRETDRGFVQTQAQLANLNEETKAAGREAARTVSKTEGSDVVKKSASWLGKNWKIVAGVAAGVVGLRMANEMFGDDELKRPPLQSSNALRFSNTPLPPPPSLERVEQGPQISTRVPAVRVMAPHGEYSQNSYRGSYSSVNSNDLGIAINMGPFTNSQGRVNIMDSRSFKSNWELQNIADAAGDSDFIYPDMGVA